MFHIFFPFFFLSRFQKFFLPRPSCAGLPSTCRFADLLCKPGNTLDCGKTPPPGQEPWSQCGATTGHILFLQMIVSAFNCSPVTDTHAYVIFTALLRQHHWRWLAPAHGSSQCQTNHVPAPNSLAWRQCQHHIQPCHCRFSNPSKGPVSCHSLWCQGKAPAAAPCRPAL